MAGSGQVIYFLTFRDIVISSNYRSKVQFAPITQHALRRSPRGIYDVSLS